MSIHAWGFDMNSGTPYNGDGKNTVKYARAVRAFQPFILGTPGLHQQTL